MIRANEEIHGVLYCVLSEPDFLVGTAEVAHQIAESILALLCRAKQLEHIGEDTGHFGPFTAGIRPEPGAVGQVALRRGHSVAAVVRALLVRSHASSSKNTQTNHYQ